MSRKTMNSCIGLSTLLALAFPAGPARAVDGVLEINQTCAELTGCFPGDVAGFPVTINTTTPGTSFRLTSDLVVPDTNPGGIVVLSAVIHDIAIDLNNFSIVRANCLVNRTIGCMPTTGASSDNSGISVAAGGEFGTSVKNGSVVGMAYYGLFLASQSEVRNVKTRWNSLTGIGAGIGSTITGSAAQENGEDGILGVGSVISGNTSSNNARDGILGIFGSVISGNTAIDNGRDGIAAFGSTVSGNAARSNGGDGIETNSGSLVERNVVESNSGFGLKLSGDTGYHGNVVAANNNTVTGGVDLGANACNGTATCP